MNQSFVMENSSEVPYNEKENQTKVDSVLNKAETTNLPNSEAANYSSDVPDGMLLSRPIFVEAENNGEEIEDSEQKIEPFSPRSDGFDMLLVSSNFERALELSEDVDLHHYIIGYRELERLFGLMGTIFGFVGDDVRDKIEILTKHRSCQHEGTNYTTVRSMMEYETAVAERLEPFRTPQNATLVSASRTLLRLHRALQFIMLFMNALIDAKDEDPVSNLAQDSYNKTLANYHGWFIRKGAIIAMNFLPNKITLMERISRHSYSEVTDIARRMTASMNPIYNRTESLYTEYMLHDLP